MLEMFLNNTCQSPVSLSKPKLDDTAFGKPSLNPQLMELINKLALRTLYYL